MLHAPSSFRKTAFALTTAAALVAASFSAANAQSVTPVVAPTAPALTKLTSEQCRFMAQQAIGMDKELHHFSADFKHSIGGFLTRAIDCSGKPVLTVMTPEDDRGIYIIGKMMFDNKQGNLYDAVYVYDPNGVADISRKFRPHQVLKTLPPDLALNSPARGPGG